MRKLNRKISQESSAFVKFFKNNKFQILSLFVIVILALILRFINYENRWGLAYDQARDTIVVNEAISRKSIPLIGPFSASGPFVFGPIWYWINIIIVMLFPDWLIVPWLFQGLASAFMSILAYLIGKNILGNKLGLIFALLAAISPARIAQSVNLTYSTFVGFVSFLLLYFVTKYILKPTTLYLFIISFLIGIAINIHFQAIGTLFILPVLLFLKGISWKKVVVILIGLVIPFIPIIIFDFSSNHFQSKNLIDFFLLGKGVPALPKRWLTYVFITWPNIWAHIIGGHLIIAYITGICITILGFIQFYKRKVNQVILSILLFFLINFVVLRYFKGGLFEAFYVYLHPTIILLTSWLTFVLYRWKKFTGIVFLLIIIIGSLGKNYTEIKNSTNIRAQESKKYMEFLMVKYPNKKFAIYDFQHKSVSISFPLVMYLQSNKLIDDHGVRIGLGLIEDSSGSAFLAHKKILGEAGNLQFFELEASTSSELQEVEWAPVNPSYIYNDIQYWYKN